MPNPVTLRGHHLLCMLTYRGEGYTPAFVENFDAMVDALNKGAEIEIVEGADAICAALHGDHGPLCASGDHCLTDRTRQRDRDAITAITKVLKLSLDAGSMLALDDERMATLRQGFADNSLRDACAGCEWHELCSQISEDGYIGVRLLP